MKTLIALSIALFSAMAFADVCTYTMYDYYRNEIQRFTRYSYSYEAACSEAQYDCKQDLAEREVRGQYGLVCNEDYIRRNPTPVPPPSYPTPYPTPYPGPSYPAPYPYPYPGPSYPAPYPTPYPGPSYPAPRPLPRDPHWPSEPRYPREPRPREPRRY